MQYWHRIGVDSMWCALWVVITQFSDQVKTRFISQLKKVISSVLQNC